MKGFIACEMGGKPVPLELSEEITAGCAIKEPFPVFLDANDAEEAVLADHARYDGPKKTYEIRNVEITIGEIHHTAEFVGDDEEDKE